MLPVRDYLQRNEKAKSGGNHIVRSPAGTRRPARASTASPTNTLGALREIAYSYKSAGVMMNLMATGLTAPPLLTHL